MKFTWRHLSITVVLLALVAIGVNEALAGGKVTVCHVPPGNPANAHTIVIAEEAWNAGHSPHQSHVLDYLGSCDPPPPPPPTQVPPTTTPRPEPTDTPDIPWTPEPTSPPPLTPTVATECYAPQAEACDTCAQLERITYQRERIANALEAANDQ